MIDSVLSFNSHGLFVNKEIEQYSIPLPLVGCILTDRDDDLPPLGLVAESTLSTQYVIDIEALDIKA